MKIVKDSKGMEYQQVNGTCYSVNTPAVVVQALEEARLSGTRIRVFYGDNVSGRCWMEENDVTGTVGRSTGRIQIPLLIKTCRSMGGGAILDSAIVKITASGKVLYEHPLFNMPKMTVVGSHVPGYTAGVDFDHSRQANFKTKTQALNFIAFMEGKRGRR